MKAFWAIATITLLALGGPTVAQAQDTGGHSGRITFAGQPPARKKIEASKDTQICGKHEILDESLVVSHDRGIKNVVVTIEGAKGGKFITQKVTLDQKGCVYLPHVVVVPTTGQLDILNSDGVLHNIHTYSTTNPVINKAQPKFKKVLTEKFAKPEIIKATCDAHNWMVGWIVATDQPFVAVTDDEGHFTIKDIPPGTYKVAIWHETLGKQRKEVSVKAREEAHLNVELAKQ